MSDRDEHWLTDELRAATPAPPTTTDLLSGVAAERRALARRRRTTTTVGSVLAAAVLVAGVSVATASNGPDQGRSIDAADRSDATGTQPFPDPPTGTKWVGLDDVVVAVPSDWAVGATPCNGTTESDVVVSAAALLRCTADGGDADRVVLLPSTSSEEVDSIDCDATLDGLCGGSDRLAGTDVQIEVQARGRGAVERIERILDSAMVLPDGWTTVPARGEEDLGTRTAVLQEAGFEVDRALQDGDTSHPVRSDPASGSPVREGATITLHQAAPQRDPAARDLSVVLAEPGADEPALAVGVARWDASRGTLTYRPRTTVFDSACEPVTTASVTADTSVALVFEVVPDRDVDCPDDSLDAVATISGLSEAPAELTVTEDGETRTVPVEQDQGAQEPSVELDGTWTVALAGDDTPDLSVTFADGSVTGTDGCVGFAGDYVLDGSALRISNLYGPEPGCADGPLPTVLDQVRSVEAPNDTLLHLRDADGRVVATLVP